MIEKQEFNNYDAINALYREKELQAINKLLAYADLTKKDKEEISNKTRELVVKVRELRKSAAGIDSFLTEYRLSSQEGIALMCLAEALLRIPDKANIDKLIHDKLTQGNWEIYKGQSESFFVNATTWALILTGKILSVDSSSNLSQLLKRWLSKSSAPVIRSAVEKAMHLMSKQFVMGRTIEEAMSRATKKEEKGYRYSYDMLGEAALTMKDADRYFEAYKNSIIAIGNNSKEIKSLYDKPGISIKLSALHPKYTEYQKTRVLQELLPKLIELAALCKSYNIGMTIDAEESERLLISLDLIAELIREKSLRDWDGLGIAVQSYQKRAFAVLDFLADLARENKRKIIIRLIKGAYWDSEIKKTQMQGLEDYPVWTRKPFTDVSFQACAKKLFTMTDVIYPQFATHNAYSVMMILQLAGTYREFEFQCLHGMGTELYEQIVPKDKFNIPCRIYAPVGSHEDLLPYLVRRLLENGANSSFVNRLVDDSLPIEAVIQDPLVEATSLLEKINTNIPLPEDIFLHEGRKNSKGLDFSDRVVQDKIKSQFETIGSSLLKPIANATALEVKDALEKAEHAYKIWSEVDVNKRAQILNDFACLLEEHTPQLLKLLVDEAHKTLFDGIGEIREAVDFCRYYAKQAVSLMQEPTLLKGYTGETNLLSLHPRGVVCCISPWNFPLAIFAGQIVAALVTGNVVIAKPAEQTPLIAAYAIDLMVKAGFKDNVVQLLPGSGEIVGKALVSDNRVKAVLFTGSNATANIICNTLAARNFEIVPLIAETGGQNAMIVDSSALLEQVIQDVLVSAFGSAGQRCSALRVLYIQDEVYDKAITLLKGAMAELEIGDPGSLKTDVGPVIDAEALALLVAHINEITKEHEVIYQCQLSENLSANFLAPIAISIPSIKVLKREVFGPVLHVIRYSSNDLDKVIDEINETHYGLTLGIHSRINTTVQYIRKRARVGNCYVNRNMIGAVVGLQPFGGEGLSGTGPKAGGPHYLTRLCTERTFTVDTTAAGGNASLMSLVED